MAEALLFSLAAFVAFSVRAAIIKWKKLDSMVDKLEKIEELKRLIEIKQNESQQK